MAPIYTCQFYLSTNKHFISSVQVYMQCTYLFLHCSFLWMSSIPAHQVPTVLRVPIQATQHKDDTNPSCFSSVLLRVLCRYSFLWMFLHPSTPSANSSHPTQGRYPVPLLGVSPFVLFRVLHQAEALRSRTPPQHLEVIIFTESPNSCDSPLMCAERVLTTYLTSRHPQNA